MITLLMLQIKLIKDVAARTRLSGELDEKRWEEISTTLLLEVPKVEIKVSN